jgi:hypothetical protein
LPDKRINRYQVSQHSSVSTQKAGLLSKENGMNLNQVTVAVNEIAPAVAFYRGLGLRLIVLSPHYARFECPNGEATFSVH